MGHWVTLLSMDNAGVTPRDQGQGQPGQTLPAPCLSLANCLASGAAAALGPGHSHNPVSCAFYSGFLLEILWVSVCFFQRLKPRHRSQVPCGQEPSAPLQQALQSSNDLPAGRLEKLFSFKVSKALGFAQHIF